jgi:hypothetical protein
MLVEILLWVAAAIGAGWALGPPLLHMLGLYWMRFVAQEDPRAVEPPSDDPDYERCYRELQALGFQPLGIVREKRWITPIHWYKDFHLRCMVSRDGLCYASLYRLSPAEPVRVSLKTFMTGNGMATTASPGAGIPDIGETTLRIEMNAGSMAELLSQHQDNVKLFAEQRGFSVTRVSFQERAARDEENDRRVLKKIETPVLYALPAFFFLGPCALALYLLNFRFSHFPMSGLLAGALCFGTLCYLGFLKLALPKMVHQECMRCHQPETNEISG